MLQSKIYLEKAKSENRRFYQEIKMLERGHELLVSYAKKSHEENLKSLKRNYYIAIAEEKQELNILKVKFDEVFPEIFMDYYSETEIVREFSQEEFEFLREMKALELCSSFDGEHYYTPTWR